MQDTTPTPEVDDIIVNDEETQGPRATATLTIEVVVTWDPTQSGDDTWFIKDDISSAIWHSGDPYADESFQVETLVIR